MFGDCRKRFRPPIVRHWPMRDSVVPELPADVFLAIVSFTDIDTCLSLRLLDHATSALISTCFTGLSIAVAHATFPGQSRLLTRESLPPPKEVTEGLAWFRELRYQQLAAILLECNEEYSAAAEDLVGDETRRLLARGWRVLHRFSIIYNDELVPPTEYGEDDAAMLARLTHSHLAVCARQMTLVHAMTLDDIRGYTALYRHLGRACAFSSDAEPLSSTRSREKAKENSLRYGIGAYIAVQLGPEAFWNTWCAPCSVTSLGNPLWQRILYALAAPHDVMSIPAYNCVDVVHEQMRCICRRVSVELDALPTGLETAWPRTSHQGRRRSIAHVHLGEPHQERVRKTARGEALPSRIIREVPFFQHLGPIGKLYGPRSEIGYSSSALRKKVGASRVPLSKGSLRIMPEFKKMFGDWEELWNKQRGWKDHIEDAWKDVEGCEECEDGVASSDNR